MVLVCGERGSPRSRHRRRDRAAVVGAGEDLAVAVGRSSGAVWKRRIAKTYLARRIRSILLYESGGWVFPLPSSGEPKSKLVSPTK